MSRIPRAAIAVLATGALFLGACSSDDAAAPANDGTRAETTSQAPEKPGIGDRVEVEGLALTIDEVSEATEIDWYEHDDDHPGGTREARDGGKFILVRTTVENTWNEDIQPSCYDVDVALHGDNDAEYGPITYYGLYPENAGCGNHLGAGFDEEATYIFEIPEKVAPVGFEFSLSDGLIPSAEKGEITIDEVREESSSEKPDPTTESTTQQATRTTTTHPAATTTSPVERGFTGAPEGDPTPLPGKTIARCATSEEGMYQQGTTWFTDGTTGWTETCAAQF